MNTHIELIKKLVQEIDDLVGESPCDCRPEPENTGHVCTRCQARAILEDYQAKEDRAICHKYLWYGSEASNRLTTDQHNAAFALGDGYGGMTIDQLRANGLTWDWSHIRDSSDAAIALIATYLRSIGKQ